MHGDAAGRQRQGDPAGPDAELERPAVAGEVGEELDGRIHDRGIVHLGGIVVGHGDFLAEVAVIVVLHAPTLPKPVRAGTGPVSAC